MDVRVALLHLGDVVYLSDSNLQGLPEIQRRTAANNRLFGEGEALQSFLVEVLDDVLARLNGHGRVEHIRATLEGVRRGESISAIARRAGRTREWWSRGVWSRAWHARSPWNLDTSYLWTDVGPPWLTADSYRWTRGSTPVSSLMARARPGADATAPIVGRPQRLRQNALAPSIHVVDRRGAADDTCMTIICIAIIDNINTCGNGGAYASARDTGIE